MRDHPLGRWQHRHDFVARRTAAERGTVWVMLLTAMTMIIEIIAGALSGSMALLADGWHMATHVAAFGIAVFAYRYAREKSADPSFAFGTGKVTVLGGFASAVALAVVALVMAIESVTRLVSPQAIAFDEAIWVACLGLAVNVASGLILHRAQHDDRGHSHGDDADHDRGGHAHAVGVDHEHGVHSHAAHDAHGAHDDHNLRAAYAHVVADALTSVLAIVALLAGKFAGIVWLDAAMGIVGAMLITRWAWGLARDGSTVLLDRQRDDAAQRAIRDVIDAEPDHAIADLHVWDLGEGRRSAAISIVSHVPRTPEYYRGRLREKVALDHLIVEVNACDDPACGGSRPRATA